MPPNLRFNPTAQGISKIKCAQLDEHKLPDAYPYKQLYDRLREEGYHDEGDKTSHLLKYVTWLNERTGYESVLDIGCGAGGSFAELGREGQEVSGVEVSSVAVRKGRELGRNVVLSSATRLPFPDNSFDLVVSADVMEHLHVDDVQAAANEAIRVARRHIFMKIATKEDVGQPWKTIAGHPLHLTIKPIEWWKQFFREAGRFIREEEYVFCLALEKQKTSKADEGATIADRLSYRASSSSAASYEAQERNNLMVTCAVKTGMLWPESPILQLGLSQNSTCLLAAIARAQDRPMTVILPDPKRAEKYLPTNDPRLTVSGIDLHDWRRTDLGSGWGMVLVDREQPLVQQSDFAKKLATRAKLVVLPAVSALGRTGMSWQPISRRYQYLYFSESATSVSVVLSNRVDPSPWFS